MAFNDTPVNSAMTIDRSSPVGNSAGIDGRGRLHVKVANTNLEPLPIALTDGSSGLNFFAAIYLVPFDVEQTVLTKIVSETNFKLTGIQVSSDNKAIFKVLVNSAEIAISRVNYLNFQASIIFTGLPLSIGDELKITVVNKTNSLANAEARITASYL